MARIQAAHQEIAVAAAVTRVKEVKTITYIFFIALIIRGITYSYAIDEVNYLLDNSKKAFAEKKTEEGLLLLDKAAHTAETQKDAKACLKIGLTYAGLPNEFDRKEFAISILKKGAEFAMAEGDTLLLSEYAKTLKNLGEKDTTIQIYDYIFFKAGELKDKDTFSILKQKYEELGDTERAELCAKMIDALTIPPPPDWQPLGESVRGPKTAPDSSQQYQRALSDQQVQATMDYFREKKKLEEQKKKKLMPTSDSSLVY